MVQWPMVSAVAGAVSVAAMLLWHILRQAYAQGRTDQRLDAIEKSQDDSDELHGLVSALKATVEALQASVQRVDQALLQLNSRIFEPGRRA